MSSTSKGRKSKLNRPASKKNLGQNQNPPYDGAYGNQPLVHILLSLMGTKCQTKVPNGGVYEGIFRTFNPKMDIAVDMVHKSKTESDQSLSSNGIDKLENDYPKEEELIEQMIFRSENFVSATFEDVDLDYAVLDVNESNGELTNQQRPTRGGEKKLEPWNGGGDVLNPDARAVGSLEAPGSEGTNGWDADEMFRENERKYGVVSDYDSSLSSYTMPIDKETEEDVEKVAKATKIAEQIERSSKHRIDRELEDGMTEEDQFSAVPRERDSRKDGRGPRDFRERDFKDMSEYGGYREKDRGDRDRDHPISPQGYRPGKHDHDRNRRGRGRDIWDKKNQGYPGQNVGHSRNMGTSGPSGGRHQPSMSQIEGPPVKPYRGASSAQVPPRFTKSGSSGHSRDEERMRQQNDNSSMHSPFSQVPKGQRQPRMMRNNTRWGPTSPSSEFGHHSPTQMHQDPAVISSSPAGGGPVLSRTSSSSSNTSASVPNPRKHLSTSSQEEQSQHPVQHHHHMRPKQSSSSPTGGAVITNTPPQQRPQPMPSTITNNPPLHEAAPGPSTWANVASRNAKPEMPRSPSGHPQQSPRSAISGIFNVGANAKLTYTPLGGTPPTGNVPQYGGRTPMGQQMPAGINLAVHPSSQDMRSMTDHPATIQGQMIHGGPANQHQQNVVTSPPQQQQIAAMPTQPGQRGTQATKAPTSVEPQKHQIEKTEDLKPATRKPSENSLPQGSTGAKSRGDPATSLTELKEFRQNFKLSTDVMNKEQPSTAHQPSKSQLRPAQSISQMPSAATRPYAPAQNQPYQQQMGQPPQTYVAAMSPQEYTAPASHLVQGPANSQIPTNQVIMQQPKPGVHPAMVPQLRQPLPHSQIPIAAPSIHNFASPQQAPSQVSPHAIEGQKAIGGRMQQPTDKSVLPMQQKTMQSPKADVAHRHHPNIHYPTGPPTPQANPSAVISVSAASPSPILSSQYQVIVTASSNIPQQQQHHRQSPTPVQAAPSSAQSAEATASIAPSTSSPGAAAVTSPTPGGKPLNPEALEFKPRTPAKSAAIATRATTPLPQQNYVPAYGIGAQPSQIIYNPGAVPPIDPIQASIAYAQFPQQFLMGQPAQHVVPVPGQQFTTFDQTGVYASPTAQPMMTPNPRMAVPNAQQQHISQFAPEQSQATVYVPVPQQAAGYIQARPQSATPVTHVTAASPAGQSTQQAPQPAGHPAAAMVNSPQQMWTMMVPPGPLPQHAQHVNQSPQIQQYINPNQMSPNVTPQAKGQQHYLAQSQPRPY